MPDLYISPSRGAAHADYLHRKVLAAGATNSRAAVIEACKAETAWAVARHCSSNPSAHQDPGYGVRALYYPHEQAAFTLLTVWGHLHPVESRAWVCRERLQAQRKAGWGDTSETAADLRYYLSERKRIKASFAKAAAAYREARRAFDLPEDLVDVEPWT